MRLRTVRIMLQQNAVKPLPIPDASKRSALHDDRAASAATCDTSGGFVQPKRIPLDLLALGGHITNLQRRNI
jgi:hypothetical protein